MNEEIKVGSVVVLNSGGPPMVVVAVEYDTVTCQWMINSGLRVHSSEFPKSCVHLTERP